MRSVEAGKIDGIDGRKDGYIPVFPAKNKTGWNVSEGWSEAQRSIHAQAIRQGKRAAKARKSSSVKLPE